MKMSSKCDYGIRAIYEIAKNYGHGYTKRKDISMNQGISDSYLEHILLSLRNHNVIDAVRGANGGYVLKKTPSEISVFDVLFALGGTMTSNDVTANQQVNYNNLYNPAIYVWEKMCKVQENVLRTITLKELIDKFDQKDVNQYSI
ncbi:MAG: Rrf2 family transcriptional regulator [Chlamydiota bacterium]|nr:Rrf2 family transcriptional regulator [Chlamydiota bacterium]